MSIHSHITYEIQLIADPHLAPSVQEVAQFFSQCLPTTTTSVTAKRGRPRKLTESDITADNCHVRCGEQLFSVNRSDQDVDEWIKEGEGMFERLQEEFRKAQEPDKSLSGCQPLPQYPAIRPIPPNDVTIIDEETS